jgi:hypothetical protein
LGRGRDDCEERGRGLRLEGGGVGVVKEWGVKIAGVEAADGVCIADGIRMADGACVVEDAWVACGAYIVGGYLDVGGVVCVVDGRYVGDIEAVEDSRLRVWGFRSVRDGLRDMPLVYPDC